MRSSGERRRDLVAFLLLVVPLCASFELQAAFENLSERESQQKSANAPSVAPLLLVLLQLETATTFSARALSLFLTASSGSRSARRRGAVTLALEASADERWRPSQVAPPRARTSRLFLSQPCSQAAVGQQRERHEEGSVLRSVLSRTSSSGFLSLSALERSSARAPCRRDDGRTCCTCELALPFFTASSALQGSGQRGCS